MKRLIISPAAAFCAALGCLSQYAVAEPGPAECRSSSGPTVCVQFDNVPDAPDELVDFEVHFTDPANPNVVLLRGRNPQGTLYNWRVWSMNSTAADGVGDIGTISSPADFDYQVKLAANGSTDHLMTFRGAFIDGFEDPSDPDNWESPGWIAYRQTWQAMKDAGFTHLGFRMDTPLVPSVIPARVADMRERFGLPLAVIVSPGMEYLTRKDFSSTGDPQSNELDEKYFNTPGFNPYLYLDTKYCPCHCTGSNCDPEDPCEADSAEVDCRPTDPPLCTNQTCVHPDPHVNSIDPKYTGSLWQDERNRLIAQLDVIPWQDGDVVIFDFEVFSSPEDVEHLYDDVIQNSPDYQDCTECPLCTYCEETPYQQYVLAWNDRVQELVDICQEYAPGRPFYFYGAEAGEGGWVRADATQADEGTSLTLAPSLYNGCNLQSYKNRLGQGVGPENCDVDYSGGLAFISFSTVNAWPCPGPGQYEAPPPLEGGVASGVCGTSFTQQVGALLRNESVAGVFVYPGPGDEGVTVEEFANHAKALASEITRTTGARNVSGITLVPTSAGKYSNIAAAEISGDLGGVVVQKSSGENGEGGVASLTIDGSVTGNVTIPMVNELEVRGGVETTSTITIGDFTEYRSADFGNSSEGFDGNLVLEAGIPLGASVTFKGELTGTVDFTGDPLAGTLSLYEGSAAGSTIIIGEMQSSSQPEGGNLHLWFGTYAGDITISSVAAGCDILANLLTGILTVAGQFNGNICANNLFDEYAIPPNIHLPDIGLQATGCEQLLCSPTGITADPSNLNKSRFISFETDYEFMQAIGVRLTSLHRVDPPYSGAASIPFAAFEGEVLYLGEPAEYVESAQSGTPFKASMLQCTPHYQDWHGVGLIHVTGPAIVPSSQYDIQQRIGENATCPTTLTAKTTRWGDIVAPFNPPSTTIQPDLADIGASVDRFKNAPGAPIRARATLAGKSGNPFGEIDPAVLGVDHGFQHISPCVDAFKGLAYPYRPGKCAVVGPNELGACFDASQCQSPNEGPCNLYCPSP